MKRTPHLFSAAGAMAERLRSIDWTATPLGPPLGWDAALKALLPVVLSSHQPMFIAWGASRTLLYNDAYAAILGDRHPDALGRDVLEVWSAARADLEPMVEAAYRGEPVQRDRLRMCIERGGRIEDAYVSVFHSPVRDESGEVAGLFGACADETAQVLAERSIAEREAWYRSVLENIEEAFTLLDREFTILEVNEAALQLTGLRRAEMVGHNHWTLFPGTHDSPLGAMYRRVLASGQAEQYEHCYVFDDGRECWLEVRAYHAGVGVAVLYRDVTERRRRREEASDAAERVQLALDAGAIVGTWIWNIPEDRVIADERFALTFGIDPAAFAAGLPIEQAFAAIHPDDVAAVRAAVERAFTGDPHYRCQYRVRSGGGPYRWVEANGRLQRDADGRPVRFPGVLQDIEERRTIEAERDRAMALLQTFFQAVPGVVYAKDREGRFLAANRGAAELLGCDDPVALVGRTDAEFLADAEQAEAVQRNDRRIMDSGVAEQLEEPVHYPDGRVAIWWSTKEPLRDADGTVIGLVGSSVDITERRQLLDALREADRRKDEFLAMLAHELRNPLAPINSAAQLLRLSGGEARRVRRPTWRAMIFCASSTRLVDDLLDVSRVTRGLVELEREPVDLQAVLASAVEQVRPLLQSRRHDLRTRVGADPVHVVGDFHRLVQVVANLLNNAAKYTPQQGVIDLRLHEEQGQAVVTVADNGVGIPAGMRERVFDLFTQGERTPDRSQGGLGIGLALVRSMAELHGGSVGVDSAGPHRGSTFTVRLPLCARPAAAVPVTLPASSGPGRRVMVVDDNLDGARMIAQVLEIVGHSVELAYTGRDALAKAAEGGPRDVYILDIGLPDMTGYELASRIRAGLAAPGTTFIALTGYGQAHDRVNSRAAGFDHHLVKPADVERLIELVAESGPAPQVAAG